MAVPSARNSGDERTEIPLIQQKLYNRVLPWNEFPAFVFCVKIVLIVSADRTGTVDFSTTILKPSVSEAILLAQASTYFKSAARPFPTP